MDSTQFVQEVFNLLGLQGPVSLPEKISFDRDLTVTILSPDKHLIVIEGTLLVLSSLDSSTQVLKQFLSVYMGRMAEQREIVAVDPLKERLILYRSIDPGSITSNEFLKILERFVNSFEYLRGMAESLTAGKANKPLEEAVNIVIP